MRRSHVLQDTMDSISSLQPEDMLKIFRFQFIGEPALDAGLFNVLLRQCADYT